MYCEYHSRLIIRHDVDVTDADRAIAELGALSLSGAGMINSFMLSCSCDHGEHIHLFLLVHYYVHSR